jgi:predicted nucleic acid-binding protein
MYRSGRRRGLTIRSSADCLIAAIAIENRVPVWHKDRDFAAIATFTDLAVV